MNREECTLPDVVITSAAPALAFYAGFLLLVLYNEQLHTPDRLVVTGKSQTSAIARPIWQGLSLYFPVTTSLSVIK